MDPLTHIGTGFVLARAGLGARHGRAAAVTLVTASIAPDVDYVMKAGGNAVYLEFHRGLTHSFAGIAALSLLLALIIRGIFFAVGTTASFSGPCSGWPSRGWGLTFSSISSTHTASALSFPSLGYGPAGTGCSSSTR